MTRRLRSLVAAAGLLLVAAVTVAPVPAHASSPVGTFSAPGDNEVLRSSPPTIAGEYRQQNGRVDKVTLSVQSLRGTAVPPPNEVFGNGSSTLPFTWAPPLSYNGPYQVRAEAVGTDQPFDPNGPETSPAILRRFALEVPPAPPADVRAKLVSTSTRHVRVSWRANSEPDLVGYQVQRAAPGKDFVAAGETPSSATSFTDEATAQAGGEYRYRVLAVRRGATDTALVASGFSSVRSETVPEPPAPPTTTTAPGDPTSTTAIEPGGGNGTGTGGRTPGGGTVPPGGGSGRAPIRPGTIDLSAFGDLLEQNRTATTLRPEEYDPGYQEAIPYGTPRSEEDLEEDSEVTFEEVQRTREVAVDRIREITFVAGAFLALVLAMTFVYMIGQAKAAPPDGMVLMPVPVDDDGAVAALPPAGPVDRTAAREARRLRRAERMGDLPAARSTVASEPLALGTATAASTTVAAAPTADDLHPNRRAARRARLGLSDTALDEAATATGVTAPMPSPAGDADVDEVHDDPEARRAARRAARSARVATSVAAVPAVAASDPAPRDDRRSARRQRTRAAAPRAEVASAAPGGDAAIPPGDAGRGRLGRLKRLVFEEPPRPEASTGDEAVPARMTPPDDEGDGRARRAAAGVPPRPARDRSARPGAVRSRR